VDTANEPLSPGEQRRADALRRADMAASAARQEAEAAQVLIDDFVARANALGLAPEPLVAHLIGGGTARTDKRGWYVNVPQTVAIGPDGAWYRLVVPGGLAERLRGVRLTPSPPTLTVLPGGRDGESGPLADFLERRLARD